MASSKAIYTDHSAPVLRTHSWRTAANSAAYLLPSIRPDMTILDVGCGPGTITLDLARLVPQGRVIGMDYVDGPLDQARAAAKEQGVPNVEFQVGDIHSLDFADDSFDVVHAHQVLQHVPDPVKSLREMRRVAKTGGGLVAARDSTSMKFHPETPETKGWLKLMEDVSHAKGGHLNSGSYIHAWAMIAGFNRSSITCTTGSWCFSTPDERAYWGGVMAERMLTPGMVSDAVDGGHATREDLEKMAQAWRDWTDNEEGWFGVLHGEILCRVE